MDMVYVPVRHEGMESCVDRGRARIEVEGAVVELYDHFIFVVAPAVDLLQALELVEIERRKAVDRHRAEISAGAFDPKHLNRRALQRISHFDLGRRIAASEI